MRGWAGMQEALSTGAKLEGFVPADHPLRAIRLLLNEALGRRLNGPFNLIHADSGRACAGNGCPGPGCDRRAPAASAPVRASRGISR